jgi:catechol 2,3-dioxygenase-like lactoylglutathione lyase family enzyme
LWLAAGGLAVAQAQVTGVAYVRVQVPDAGKSAVFYEQVMGLERMPARPGGDGMLVLRIGRSQHLELVTGAVPAAGPITETGLLSEGDARPAVTDPENQRLVFAGARRAWSGRETAARPAPMADHLLHVALLAKDLDRSQAFYTALGCRTEWRGPTPSDVRLAILRVSPTSRDFVELVAHNRLFMF